MGDLREVDRLTDRSIELLEGSILRPGVAAVKRRWNRPQLGSQSPSACSQIDRQIDHPIDQSHYHLPRMSLDQVRQFCRSLPDVSEDVKWGNDLVFTIGGRMFCVVCLEPPHQIAFKCTPE